MGYDMFWVKTPKNVERRLTVARTAVEAARSALDDVPADERGSWHAIERRFVGQTERYKHAQQQFNDALDAYRQIDVTSFRLNIHGMSTYLERMGHYQMLDRGDGFPGFRTERDVFSLLGVSDDASDDDLRAAYEALIERCTDEALLPQFRTAYEQAKDPAVKAAARELREHDVAMLSWCGDDPTGIVVHKLCSNDGWHVTELECRRAVDAWKRLDRPGDDPTDYWRAWIAFIEGAGSDGGGFVVY